MSQVEELSTAIRDMAKHYGVGTPESRAILTALEHGRITVGLDKEHITCTCLSELDDDAYGPGGPLSGQRRPPPCQATTHRR